MLERTFNFNQTSAILTSTKEHSVWGGIDERVGDRMIEPAFILNVKVIVFPFGLREINETGQSFGRHENKAVDSRGTRLSSDTFEIFSHLTD